MKILGLSPDGYLVSMKAAEIYQCVGVKYAHETKEMPGFSDGKPTLGMSIDIVKMANWHARIEEHQAKARKSAETLRALAAMIEFGLPDATIPAQASESLPEGSDKEE